MTRNQLKFPCDCISSTPACEEAWARVAKEGMFKNGTKEEILNRVHAEPLTIAQIAEAMRLARPTIHRHVMELLEAGLIEEVNPEGKSWTVERYYRPNFPVVSDSDQELFDKGITALAEDFARAFHKRLPALRQRFAASRAGADGWEFGEIGYYLWHEAQRMARRSLEAEGDLDPRIRKGERDFIFWAKE